MQLLKSKYKGFKPVETDEWGYYSLRYESANLIISNKLKNKVGFVRNINCFADMVLKESEVMRGYWEFIVVNDDGKEIKYKFLAAKSLLEEEVFVDDKVVLHRTKDIISIYSPKNDTFSDIKSDVNKLAVQTIDDSEYWFLNDFRVWAKNLKTMQADDINKADVDNFANINLTSQLLEAVKKDFNNTGYQIESIVKNEEGIFLQQTHSTEEEHINNVNDELKRTFWMLAFVHDLVRRKNEVSSLFIRNDNFSFPGNKTDDLYRTIISTLLKARIQFIIVSDNLQLLNELSMEYWSILYLDEDKTVRALHHNNSRYKFKELMKQGLDKFEEVFA